jgi:hypothetical protein
MGKSAASYGPLGDGGMAKGPNSQRDTINSVNSVSSSKAKETKKSFRESWRARRGSEVRPAL